MSPNHFKYHSSSAFCGNAGPEELAHLQELISVLSDNELQILVERIGIKFATDQKNISRYDFEMVIDEASREDFYREYKKILELRENKTV